MTLKLTHESELTLKELAPIFGLTTREFARCMTGLARPSPELVRGVRTFRLFCSQVPYPRRKALLSVYDLLLDKDYVGALGVLS